MAESESAILAVIESSAAADADSAALDRA